MAETVGGLVVLREGREALVADGGGEVWVVEWIDLSSGWACSCGKPSCRHRCAVGMSLSMAEALALAAGQGSGVAPGSQSQTKVPPRDMSGPGKGLTAWWREYQAAGRVVERDVEVRHVDPEELRARRKARRVVGPFGAIDQEGDQ